MLDALLRQELGLRYRLQAVPYPLLQALAGGMELWASLSGKEPLLTRYSVAAVHFDMTLSQTRAIEELGYRPRYSMEEDPPDRRVAAAARRHTAWLRSPYLKWAIARISAAWRCAAPGSVCKFPARAYLLEVGQRRWLWDTGYAHYFQQHTQSGVFSLYRRMTPVYFDPAESLAHQLREAGYAEGDIRALIVSHFHADHIAGLQDFSHLDFICSGEGWQQTRGLRGFAALKRAFIPGLIPADFESRLQFMEAFPSVALPALLAPFDRGYALPGSEGQMSGAAAGACGRPYRRLYPHRRRLDAVGQRRRPSPQSYQTLRGPSRQSGDGRRSGVHPHAGTA